jgi:putative ABC transport system permease protein
MSGLRQDVTFAVRMLLKDRRFTIAAVLALGLAIGVNNSVFTLINTALIRELPFDRADRLVSINVPGPRGPSGVSYPDLLDWRASASAFEALAGTMNSVMNLSETDRPPDRFRGTYVSANTFKLLRTTPILGRDFMPDDDRPGAPPVAIIGFGVWQDRYGGDRGVIGRSVRVNDVPATIIGVMPQGFSYPMINQLWQPLSVAPALAKPRRDARNLGVIGRLADGADLARAQTDLATIAAQLARDYPDTNKDTRPVVGWMRDSHTRFGLSMLMTFMGAVVLVLLIACANLANLLLARSTSRAREIAIRASLGATRWRIVRQLLLECAFIAALAGVLGAVFSIYGAQTIAVGFDIIEPGAPPGSTRPFWVNTSMDGSILAFIGLLAVFATFACGLIPALQISRTDVNDVLKDGSRTGGSGAKARRLAGVFVVAEIALTLMLLGAAGLLWRGFIERYQADPVIDTSNLISMRIGLPVTTYATPEARRRFYDALDQRLVGLPGVAASTITNQPPLEFGAPSRDLVLDGQVVEPGQTLPTVALIQTGQRFFETIRLPLVRGRAFTALDGGVGHETAIVDERFVSTFVPNGEALGQRIQLTSQNPQQAASPWLTIVGVVPRLPHSGPPELARPVVYVAMPAIPLQGPAAILIRAQSRSQMTPVIAALREAVAGLDAGLPLYAVQTVDAILERGRYPTRLVGTWFGIIALIAVVLAAVGLYALTAHAVAQRMQEIGIRMALGAQPAEVLWLFMRRASVQLAIGIALGLAGMLAAGKLLQSYLVDVGPRDPLTLSIVAGLLIVVALVSSVMPARRATRVDPVVALRCE